MGKLIDENDLRPPRNDRIEVHFIEPLAPILDTPAGNDFKAFEQRLGSLAAVGLDDPDDDVVTVGFAGTGLLQHLVGLADAGRRADEDPELADAALLPAG